MVEVVAAAVVAAVAARSALEAAVVAAVVAVVAAAVVTATATAVAPGESEPMLVPAVQAPAVLPFLHQHQLPCASALCWALLHRIR